MTKTQRLIAFVLLVCITLACNLPSGSPTESPVASEGSISPTATLTETATATPIPATGTACAPTVVTNTDANVRNGPGQVYGILGQLPQGTTANVAGKNSDGSWWYIAFPAGPGGYAWIAGSVTTAICIPSTLAIIAAPPTPTFTSTSTPTSTPTITPTSGLIIVFPPVFIIPSATPTLGFIFPFPIFTVGP